MKRKILLMILSWLLFPAMLLAADEEKISQVYLENDTPFAIKIGKSHYNQTPLSILRDHLEPYKKQRIAEGEILKNRVNIAFYLQMSDKEDARNTPLIQFNLKVPTHYSIDVQPSRVVLNKIDYDVLSSMIGTNLYVKIQKHGLRNDFIY